MHDQRLSGTAWISLYSILVHIRRHSLCTSPTLPQHLVPQSTYIRRVQSCAWRLPKYWPPAPLSTQRVCPPPAPKEGGYTLAGRREVWGSIFWKTPAIGLASYNNLSTPCTVHPLKIPSGQIRSAWEWYHRPRKGHQENRIYDEFQQSAIQTKIAQHFCGIFHQI